MEYEAASVINPSKIHVEPQDEDEEARAEEEEQQLMERGV